MTKSVVLSKRQNYTSDQKCQIVDDYKKSGLSLKNFCDKTGLSKATVYNWLKSPKQHLENQPGQAKEQTEETDPQNLPTVAHRPTLEDLTNISTILAENEILKGQLQRLQSDLDEYQRVLGQSLFESRKRRAA